MNKNNRLLIALLVILLISLMAVSTVSAHNAGHVILPSGECINVGSGKSGPELFEGHPHVVRELDEEGNVVWRLDLIDWRGDQYGARFAAEQGNSAVLPGECSP